jgi:hypothetical protein
MRTGKPRPKIEDRLIPPPLGAALRRRRFASRNFKAIRSP